MLPELPHLDAVQRPQENAIVLDAGGQQQPPAVEVLHGQEGGLVRAEVAHDLDAAAAELSPAAVLLQERRW